MEKAVCIPTLLGDRIVLRGVKESDIEDRLAIGRHHEFVHMCGGETLFAPEYPQRTVWEDWYLHQQAQETSWIIALDGRCIGNARLHHLSTEDKSAAYAIGIFDPSCHGMGIGSEATRLVLQYAFEIMGLHRVYLKVLSYNCRAIKCYEKCGFQQEGLLRESAFIEGAYFSDMIMSILEEEYRKQYSF